MIAMFHASDVKESDAPLTENQQIMFDYATKATLPILEANGAWIAPAPRSPLSMEEIVRVYLLIVEHDSYQGQTMKMADNEGCWVTYQPDGMVLVEMPQPPEGCDES